MKNTGVSLVEILIGVVLLVLLLVPSLNVVIGQTKTVTATRDHSQAAFVADKIMETAHSYDFNLLDADRYAKEPEKQKKTLEYRLKNSPEYNKYEVNGITYTIDSDFTSIDPIKTLNAAESIQPNVYAFKYSIKYIGKDNKEHLLNVHTILSKR